MKINFAVLIFDCTKCKYRHELDITEKRENKYNYDCKCGAKYLINFTRGSIRRIK